MSPLVHTPSTRRKLLTLLSFSLLFCSHFAAAQHPDLEFEIYDTRQGLSQNQVYDITQDKNGFIWFGTDEGLNRFDGHEFKIFRHDNNNPHSLIDNSVHSLLVDNDGTLWIGTSNGINRYYPDTELMEQLAIQPDDPKLPKGTNVTVFRKDSKGNIWIGYLGSGLDFYDREKKQFFQYATHQGHRRQLINDYVIAMQFMPDGDNLLGTRAGIQVIGPDGIPLSEELAQKKYPWKNQIHNSITTFYWSDNRRILWIGTELNGFYKVDIDTHEVKNFTTENSALKFNNNVLSVFEDSRGNMWVGGEAIYILDPSGDSLIEFNEFGIQGNVTNRNPVWSIFEDKDNNIWFGTFRFGALKYNPYNTQMQHFHSKQGEGSIGHDQILSLKQDGVGTLWIGTDGGGLYRMRPGSRDFEKAPLNEKFSSQVIKCMYQDAEGNFWLGTWDGGMMKYHPDKKILETYSPEKGNFDSRHVWDIEGDTLGNLWLGTLREGLSYFSTKTKKYKYYRTIPDDTTSLPNNDILCLFMDSRNILWVGTSNGLSLLRPGSDKFEHFDKKELNFIVLSAYEDDQHNIWLGTNGGGIFIVNPQFKIIKRITEKDGLPSATICAMEEDTNKNVWVSTYNGFVKISRSDYSITEVPLIAGLQGKEFIPRSSARLSDGVMVFGGVNGFNMFHPDSLHFNPTPKKIVFTSFRINNDEISPNAPYQGRQILNKSITDTESLRLSYRDHSFTLTFSSLSYNWQNSLHYAYMLENLDNEWQYLSAEKRYIHYTNLDPGEYTLKVKTSFDGKQWPDEAKILSIYIEPPWWGTTWFKIALGLLVVFTLYGVYKTRVRFLHHQRLKLEELVKQRTLELKKSNEEIQLLLLEVAEKKRQIEEQMHELKHVNEELGAQRDTLEARGIELEKTQRKLREINANLEVLVDKRTQKLTDALRELETFLYRASHDLRGPISSMLGLIGLARIEKDPIQYNKMYTEFLQRTVMALDRTLQKLLQKHTIEKKKVYYEKINRNSLLMMLEDILNEIPFYRPEDLKVEMDDYLYIETDRMLLSIILSNLLENAFFFNSQAADQKVLLTARQDEKFVVLAVEDHGPGVKPELKDKIFTMFYRGSERSTGNGLGLYLIRNVLEKINGTITLETEEGKYARFIVTLPRYHEVALEVK